MSSAGFNGQFGFKSETVVGTAVTVDAFLPVLNVGIVQDIQQLESQGIRAGQLVQAASKQGQREIGGTVAMELWNTDIAALLRHCFGDHGVTGSGPFEHTYEPSGLVDTTFTAQVGIPDIAGTIHPFTWAGCKVNQWTVTANVGELAQLALDVIAMSESTSESLATASYDEGLEPFTFVEGALSVAGSPLQTVRSVNLQGTNGLARRVRLGSGDSKEPLENEMREYTGTVESDFNTLADYNRFVTGAASALVLKFDNGTDSLEFTLNVKYTGSTPQLTGPDFVAHSLPFKAFGDTNAEAITAVLINGEADAA